MSSDSIQLSALPMKAIRPSPTPDLGAQATAQASLSSPHTAASHTTTPPAALEHTRANQPQALPTAAGAVVRSADSAGGAQVVTAEPLIKPAAVEQGALDPQPPTEEAAPAKQEDLQALVREINEQLYSMNRALRFEIHEDTESLVVKVVNTKTSEVVRQHPSEEVLARQERILAGDLGFFMTEVS